MLSHSGLAVSEDTARPARPDVSKELAKLKFEKKNQSQPRLPPNTGIQRRPLNHAPIASPFAGKDVQKIVYVSRKTPIMSAVKRVKTLLSHIEKRALQGVNLAKDKHGMTKLAEASGRLARDGEKVYVKASGRAMEQALRIADWFRHREDEMSCDVEVSTGSVQAVDDIVEVECDRDEVDDREATEMENTHNEAEESTGLRSSNTDPEELVTASNKAGVTGQDGPAASGSPERQDTKQASRRRKRRRREYDKDDVPEARIRWIKTVEVAISLKG